MKFGKRLAIASIKGFDSEPVYKEKLKWNLTREKSVQIFTVIKYQNKVLDVFVYL